VYDYHRPIEQRIAWLFDHARRRSEAFRAPEAWLARQRYLAEHPTAILVLKCMDGRINIPVATKTPVGIIQSFRNLGGVFDLGWPYLGEVLARHIQEAVSAGRRVLVLISYHYSKGSAARGCAGFHYDAEAARAHAYALRRQFEAVFGESHDTVYPIVAGFETDEDALTLHDGDGAYLDLATLAADKDGASLPGSIGQLYPDMPEQVRRDLLPLLLGNLEHIAHVRPLNRSLDIEHREWMICVGRGFDWLHFPNLALIIGPYSPNLADPVRQAAHIIRANMSAGRIPDDGFLLLATAPYTETGMDRARAVLKSQFLSRFAADVITDEYPDMAALMHRRTVVLDWRSRALEEVEG
jgi:hypothetical protein